MDQQPKGRQGSGRGGGRVGRGGRGARRGRGGRHYDGGRNAREKTEKATHPSGQTDRKQDIDRDSEQSWLVDALEALACPNATEWRDAASLTTPKANEHLAKLAVWLEDRCIRLWDFAERRHLKKDFWGTVNRYLRDLDCPPAYYQSSAGGDGSADETGLSWRTDVRRRVRVVHWLLACATSELHGDLFAHQRDSPVEKEKAAATMSTPQKQMTFDMTTADRRNFPLGFSTGNDRVDDILTVLRMNLLLQLEEEQHKINQAVAELQRQSVPDAKPLKRYKPRKNR